MDDHHAYADFRNPRLFSGTSDSKDANFSLAVHHNVVPSSGTPTSFSPAFSSSSFLGPPVSSNIFPVPAPRPPASQRSGWGSPSVVYEAAPSPLPSAAPVSPPSVMRIAEGSASLENSGSSYSSPPPSSFASSSSLAREPPLLPSPSAADISDGQAFSWGDSRTERRMEDMESAVSAAVASGLRRSKRERKVNKRFTEGDMDAQEERSGGIASSLSETQESNPASSCQFSFFTSNSEELSTESARKRGKDFYGVKAMEEQQRQEGDDERKNESEDEDEEDDSCLLGGRSFCDSWREEIPKHLSRWRILQGVHPERDLLEMLKRRVELFEPSLCEDPQAVMTSLVADYQKMKYAFYVHQGMRLKGGISVGRYRPHQLSGQSTSGSKEGMGKKETTVGEKQGKERSRRGDKSKFPEFLYAVVRPLEKSSLLGNGRITIDGECVPLGRSQAVTKVSARRKPPPPPTPTKWSSHDPIDFLPSGTPSTPCERLTTVSQEPQEENLFFSSNSVANSAFSVPALHASCTASPVVTPSLEEKVQGLRNPAAQEDSVLTQNEAAKAVEGENQRNVEDKCVGSIGLSNPYNEDTVVSSDALVSQAQNDSTPALGVSSGIEQSRSSEPASLFSDEESEVGVATNNSRDKVEVGKRSSRASINERLASRKHRMKAKRDPAKLLSALMGEIAGSKSEAASISNLARKENNISTTVSSSINNSQTISNMRLQQGVSIVPISKQTGELRIPKHRKGDRTFPALPATDTGAVTGGISGMYTSDLSVTPVSNRVNVAVDDVKSTGGGISSTPDEPRSGEGEDGGWPLPQEYQETRKLNETERFPSHPSDLGGAARSCQQEIASSAFSSVSFGHGGTILPQGNPYGGLPPYSTGPPPRVFCNSFIGQLGGMPRGPYPHMYYAPPVGQNSENQTPSGTGGAAPLTFPGEHPRHIGYRPRAMRYVAHRGQSSSQSKLRVIYPTAQLAEGRASGSGFSLEAFSQPIPADDFRTGNSRSPTIAPPLLSSLPPSGEGASSNSGHALEAPALLSGPGPESGNIPSNLPAFTNTAFSSRKIVTPALSQPFEKVSLPDNREERDVRQNLVAVEQRNDATDGLTNPHAQGEQQYCVEAQRFMPTDVKQPTSALDAPERDSVTSLHRNDVRRRIGNGNDISVDDCQPGRTVCEDEREQGRFGDIPVGFCKRPRMTEISLPHNTAGTASGIDSDCRQPGSTSLTLDTRLSGSATPPNAHFGYGSSRGSDTPPQAPEVVEAAVPECAIPPHHFGYGASKRTEQESPLVVEKQTDIEQKSSHSSAAKWEGEREHLGYRRMPTPPSQPLTPPTLVSREGSEEIDGKKEFQRDVSRNREYLPLGAGLIEEVIGRRPHLKSDGDLDDARSDSIDSASPISSLSSNVDDPSSPEPSPPHQESQRLSTIYGRVDVRTHPSGTFSAASASSSYSTSSSPLNDLEDDFGSNGVHIGYSSRQRVYAPYQLPYHNLVSSDTITNNAPSGSNRRRSSSSQSNSLSPHLSYCNSISSSAPSAGLLGMHPGSKYHSSSSARRHSPSRTTCASSTIAESSGSGSCYGSGRGARNYSSLGSATFGPGRGVGQRYGHDRSQHRRGRRGAPCSHGGPFVSGGPAYDFVSYGRGQSGVAHPYNQRGSFPYVIQRRRRKVKQTLSGE